MVAGREASSARVLPDDLPEVRDRRARPDLLQDVVGARRASELRHRALLVLEIAERDRARRAGLLARGEDVAVLHGALVVAGVVLARDDPLHAHRALLHHAELADRHVGVQLHLERRWDLPLEPIEATHVVRAVVAAVARPHAAVVDLRVQPLVRPVGREDGTDRLAPRDFTVLAEQRQGKGSRGAPGPPPPRARSGSGAPPPPPRPPPA